LNKVEELMKSADKEVGGLQLPEDSPSWLIQLAGAVQSIPREEFMRHITSYTDALEKRWRDSAREEVKRLVAAYDLQPKDVFVRSGLSARGGLIAAVQYRDGKTGKTWSGRGRKPAWLSGKDLAEFRVQA